jgi:hypothetical protein
MLDSTKPIQLFDDTGRGDSFDVTKILYEDNDIIVVEAFNEWYTNSLKFMIEKKKCVVYGNDIMFYLAKNV